MGPLGRFCKAYFFQQCIFLHIFPLPQSIETKKWHLSIFFGWQNLLFWQNNYMYWFKKCHYYWFWTSRVTFPKKSTSLEKLFQSKLLICTQNPKKYIFGQFYMKAEGQRISEHPGLKLWPKIFRKKIFCKHRQCSYTAPKKSIFWSASGHKTLSYHEKRKTRFQMTYTIGMVWSRQFIEPGLGVST